MNKEMTHDYEIIDGKPHLGLWFGKLLYINRDAYLDRYEENKNNVIRLLQDFARRSAPIGTQPRHIQIIHKPISSYDIMFNPISSRETIAIKFMIWGRAFKVMKLNKKSVKRYAKRRVSGRIRRVRIDK